MNLYYAAQRQNEIVHAVIKPQFYLKWMKDKFCKQRDCY